MPDENINKNEENKEESESTDKAEDKSDEEFEEIFEHKRKPYAFAAVIVIAFVIGFFVSPAITGQFISVASNPETAAKNIVAYINQNIVAGGGVNLVGVEEKYGIYEITTDYRGQTVKVYSSKDGKFLIIGRGIDTTKSLLPEEPQQQNVLKSDKPKVELFVMTHCPYGAQAEKGIVPVLKLLGDKIDSKIRFVHYFMHGDKEEQETYRQICIREEQRDKYLTYLECFLSDGDSERCLTETDIDVGALDSCMESKSKDYYAEDSELSKGYNVRGSPTLVINGQIASSGRSSSAFLSTICSAFNVAPEECKQAMSSENPSPGFGYSGSGSENTASCG